MEPFINCAAIYPVIQTVTNIVADNSYTSGCICASSPLSCRVLNLQTFFCPVVIARSLRGVITRTANHCLLEQVSPCWKFWIITSSNVPPDRLRSPNTRKREGADQEGLADEIQIMNNESHIEHKDDNC